MKKAKAVVLSLVLAMSVMVGLVACNEKEEHVHSYGAWQTVKAATCTEDGEEKRVCSECGDEQKRVLESRGSHSYGKWQETKEAKCEEAGEEERVCSECGDVQTREIEPLGYHSYGRWQVEQEATCGIAGARKRTCTVCGKEEIQDIEALTHRYGNWQIVKPTDEEPGSAVKVCSRCVDGIEGHTVSVELPVLTDEGYTKVAKGNEPSCLKGSITIYTITISGEVFKFESETEALGHRYGDWTIEAPSDIEGGIATRYCDRCEPGTAGHVETKSLPALTDEGYTKVSDTATCVDVGESKYEITIDGEKIEFTIDTPAKGHTYGAWNVEKPTEDKPGKASKECSICDGETKGHKVEIELPVLGDSSYIIECEKVQDCTQSTTGTYKYSYLDEVISFEAAIQGGHRYGLTFKSIPTFEDQGVVGAECVKCGNALDDIILPILNSPLYTLTDNTATCIDGGTGRYSLSVAGIDISFTGVTGELGHIYEGDSKICTRCQENKDDVFESIFCGTWLPDTSLVLGNEQIVIDKNSVLWGDKQSTKVSRVSSSGSNTVATRSFTVNNKNYTLRFYPTIYTSTDNYTKFYRMVFDGVNYYKTDCLMEAFDENASGIWDCEINTTGYHVSFVQLRGRSVFLDGIKGTIKMYTKNENGYSVRFSANIGADDNYTGASGYNTYTFDVNYDENAKSLTLNEVNMMAYKCTKRAEEVHPERKGTYVSSDGKNVGVYTDKGEFYYNDIYCFIFDENGLCFIYDDVRYEFSYNDKDKTITLNCLWLNIENLVLSYRDEQPA